MLSALRHALDLDFRFEISKCRFCLQFCSSSFCCVSALLLVDVEYLLIALKISNFVFSLQNFHLNSHMQKHGIIQKLMDTK